MANFKNITELPVAESADGLKLIVNDDGAAKQIAASAVGAQADWAETDETSVAFIKNKPVEEYDIDAAFKWNFDKESGERTLEKNIKHIADFQVLKDKIISGVELKHKIAYAVQYDDDLQHFAYGYNRFSFYYCPAYVVADEEVSDPENIYFNISASEMGLDFYLYSDNTLSYEE